MSNLQTCRFCGAPATRGYADMPQSQRCDTCNLAHEVGTSATDARQIIDACSDPEQLRRALKRELGDARRVTVIKMLETRMRKLGKKGGAS